MTGFHPSFHTSTADDDRQRRVETLRHKLFDASPNQMVSQRVVTPTVEEVCALGFATTEDDSAAYDVSDTTPVEPLCEDDLRALTDVYVDSVVRAVGYAANARRYYGVTADDNIISLYDTI